MCFFVFVDRMQKTAGGDDLRENARQRIPSALSEMRQMSQIAERRPVLPVRRAAVLSRMSLDRSFGQSGRAAAADHGDEARQMKNRPAPNAHEKKEMIPP